MDSNDFSIHAMLKRLGNLSLSQHQFFELRLAPFLHLLCGGPPESVDLDRNGYVAPDSKALLPWIERQTAEQHVFTGLESTQRVLRQSARPGSHLGVTIEAAIPGAEPLSIGLIAYKWLHAQIPGLNSQDPTVQLRQGTREQLLLSLATMDFLTVAPGSGVGAVATRSMYLEVEPGAKEFKRLQLQAHFGHLSASVVLRTPVMRLLMTGDAGIETLNLQLRQTGIASRDMGDLERILQASLLCLGARRGASLESVKDEVARSLGYTHPQLLLEARKLGTGAAPAVESLGIELYKCAVQGFLDSLSAAGSGAAAAGADSGAAASALTVVEVVAYAPASFARELEAAPAPRPEQPGAEGSSMAAGASVALRAWHQELVFNWRWARHLQPNGLLAPSTELLLSELFSRAGPAGGGLAPSSAVARELRQSREVARLLDYPHHGQERPEALVEQVLEEFQAGDRGTVSLQELKAAWAKVLWADLQARATEQIGADSEEGRTEGCDGWKEWSHGVKLAGFEAELAQGAGGPGCAGAWGLLARSAGVEAWRRHCLGRAEACQAEPGDGMPRVVGDVLELLQDCDERLVLKIVYAHAGQASSASVAAQLALLECPLLVSIWRLLFPVRASVPEDFLGQAGLREFVDFVRLPVGGALCLSLPAWRAWSLAQASAAAGSLPRPPLGIYRAGEEQQPTSLPGLAHVAEQPAPGWQDRQRVPGLRQAVEQAVPGWQDGQLPAAPKFMEEPAWHTREPLGPAPIVEAAPDLQDQEQEAWAPPERHGVRQAKVLLGRSRPVEAEGGKPRERRWGVGTQDRSVDGSVREESVAEDEQVQAPDTPPSKDDGIKWDEHEVRSFPREILLCGVNPWSGFRGDDPATLNPPRHWEDSFFEDLSDRDEFKSGRISWVSASELCQLRHAPGSGPMHICKSIDPLTVKQGLVGDCWLIAAISVLAEFQKPIQRVFARCEQLRSWPAPQQGVDGPYELVLHNPQSNFKAEAVKINDRVPCFQRPDGGWQPCFASTLRLEMWPMLLEKGIAKLLGGYKRLDGSRAPYAWAIITGQTEYGVYFPWESGRAAQAPGTAPAEGLSWGEGSFEDLKGRPSAYAFKQQSANTLTSERVWESLRVMDLDDKLMACTFRAEAPAAEVAGGEQSFEQSAGHGLLAGHAYSLIAVKQVCGQRLLQVRNPWGDGCEWTGPWSDSSPEWAEHPEVARALSYTERQRREDGLFWMPWDELCGRVKDIVFSRAPVAKASPQLDWSAPCDEAALKAATGRSPDLWQNFSTHDPDQLQQDVSSWADGFSDSSLSLGREASLPSGIQWVSASRVHRLVQWEQPDLSDDVLPDRRQYLERWARIAAESGLEAARSVHTCERVDARVLDSAERNCWFAAALAPLAQLQWPVRDVFSQCPKRPYEQKDGPYSLSFYNPANEFRKVVIKVNDRVPCFPQYSNRRDRAAGWRPCFARSLYREMWPMLLEKGVAKMLGGYHQLRCNRAPLLWAMLTGEPGYGAYFPWTPDSSASDGPGEGAACGASVSSWGEGKFDTESFDLQGRLRSHYRYEPRCSNEHSADWIWYRLRVLSMDGRLMSCTFRDSLQGDRIGDGGDEGCAGGLMAGFAYAILAVRSVAEDGSGSQRGGSVRVEHRLIQLLSPWRGDQEWQGRWSNRSGEWESHPAAAKELGHMEQQKHPHDGLFWMCWEDFQERVSEIVFSEVGYTCGSSKGSQLQAPTSPLQPGPDVSANGAIQSKGRLPAVAAFQAEPVEAYPVVMSPDCDACSALEGERAASVALHPTRSAVYQPFPPVGNHQPSSEARMLRTFQPMQSQDGSTERSAVRLESAPEHAPSSLHSYSEAQMLRTSQPVQRQDGNTERSAALLESAPMHSPSSLRSYRDAQLPRAHQPMQSPDSNIERSAVLLESAPVHTAQALPEQAGSPVLGQSYPPRHDPITPAFGDPPLSQGPALLNPMNSAASAGGRGGVDVGLEAPVQAGRMPQMPMPARMRSNDVVHQPVVVSGTPTPSMLGGSPLGVPSQPIASVLPQRTERAVQFASAVSELGGGEPHANAVSSRGAGSDARAGRSSARGPGAGSGASASSSASAAPADHVSSESDEGAAGNSGTESASSSEGSRAEVARHGGSGSSRGGRSGSSRGARSGSGSSSGEAAGSSGAEQARASVILAAKLRLAPRTGDGSFPRSREVGDLLRQALVELCGLETREVDVRVVRRVRFPEAPQGAHTSLSPKTRGVDVEFAILARRAEADQSRRVRKRFQRYFFSDAAVGRAELHRIFRIVDTNIVGARPRALPEPPPDRDGESRAPLPGPPAPPPEAPPPGPFAAAAPLAAVAAAAPRRGRFEPEIAAHFDIGDARGFMLNQGTTSFRELLKDALCSWLDLGREHIGEIEHQRLRAPREAPAGDPYTVFVRIRPRSNPIPLRLLDIRDLQQKLYNFFGCSDAQFFRQFAKGQRVHVCTSLFRSLGPLAGPALVGSPAASAVYARAHIRCATAAADGLYGVSRHSRQVRSFVRALAECLELGMDAVRERCAERTTVANIVQVDFEVHPPSHMSTVQSMQELQQRLLALNEPWVTFCAGQRGLCCRTDGELSLVDDRKAWTRFQMVNEQNNGPAGVSLRTTWCGHYVVHEGLGRLKLRQASDGSTSLWDPQGGPVDVGGVRHFRMITEGRVPDLVAGSLVLDSAVRHMPQCVSEAVDDEPMTLCAHVDIADPYKTCRVDSKESAGRAFVEALAELAREGSLERLTFQLGSVRRAEPVPGYRPRLRDRDGGAVVPMGGAPAAAAAAVDFYCVDFEVRFNRNDLQQVHELLWTVNDEGIEALDITKRLAFFKTFEVASSVRICAASVCHADPCCGSFAPSTQQRQPTFTAYVDVVDRLCLLKRYGLPHFASLFGDALHVTSGVAAAQLTVLDVRPLERRQQPAWPNEVGLGPRPRYQVFFEVRFPDDNPDYLQVQRVFEAVWKLHSVHTCSKWASLPFFARYAVESCVEIDVPSAAYQVRPGLLPNMVVDKLTAHLDLVDRNPRRPYYSRRDGSAWTISLAEAFCEALDRGLGIPREYVAVTCIRFRPGHLQWTDLAMRRDQRECCVERKTDGRDSDSDDDRNRPEDQVDAGGGYGQYGRGAFGYGGGGAGGGGGGRSADGGGGDACRVGGYTVEFEICPGTAISDKAFFLEDVRGRLRKLHSAALRSPRVDLQLFRDFCVDCGLQLRATPGCSERELEERHTFPQGRLVGPTVFASSLAESEQVPSERLTFGGHVDVMDRLSPLGGFAQHSAREVGEWFLEAVRRQLRGNRFRTHFVPSAATDPNYVAPPGDVDAQNLCALYVLPPEDAGAVLDGLILEVTGVRAKGAQTCHLDRRYLENARFGHDSARLAGDLRGFSIDFEARPLRRDGQRCEAAFADQLRDELLRFAGMAHGRMRRNGCPFFSRFVLDRGVQISSSQPHGLIERSLAPARVGVAVRMAAREGSLHSPQMSNPSRLRQVFPSLIALALGIEAAQVENVTFEPMAQYGMYAVNFEVSTLAHTPALREVQELRAKLVAMNAHMHSATRWWIDAFETHRPIAVFETTNATAAPPAPECDHVADFAIQLGEANLRDFQESRRRDLLDAVATRLGVSQAHVALCGLQGRSALVRVGGLRSSAEADLLATLLGELRGNRPLLWGPEWGEHGVLAANGGQMPALPDVAPLAPTPPEPRAFLEAQAPQAGLPLAVRQPDAANLQSLSLKELMQKVACLDASRWTDKEHERQVQAALSRARSQLGRGVSELRSIDTHTQGSFMLACVHSLSAVLEEASWVKLRCQNKYIVVGDDGSLEAAAVRQEDAAHFILKSTEDLRTPSFRLGIEDRSKRVIYVAVDGRDALAAGGELANPAVFKGEAHGGPDIALQLQDGRNVRLGDYGVLQIGHGPGRFMVERVPEASLLLDTNLQRVLREMQDAAASVHRLCCAHFDDSLRAQARAGCKASVPSRLARGAAPEAPPGAGLFARLGGHDVLAQLVERLVGMLEGALREPELVSRVNVRPLNGLVPNVLDAFERTVWNTCALELSTLAEMTRCNAGCSYFWCDPYARLWSLGMRILHALGGACRACKEGRFDASLEFKELVSALSRSAVNMVCHSCSVAQSVQHAHAQCARELRDMLWVISSDPTSDESSNTFKRTQLKLQSRFSQDSIPEVVEVWGVSSSARQAFEGKYRIHLGTGAMAPAWLHESQYRLFNDGNSWRVVDQVGSLILEGQECERELVSPDQTSGLWQRSTGQPIGPLFHVLPSLRG